MYQGLIRNLEDLASSDVRNFKNLDLEISIIFQIFFLIEIFSFLNNKFNLFKLVKRCSGKKSERLFSTAKQIFFNF